MSYPYYEEDRGFLHDMSSPVAVARMMIGRGLKELQNATPETLEKAVQRFEKAVAELERVETLLAEQKARITLRNAEPAGGA